MSNKHPIDKWLNQSFEQAPQSDLEPVWDKVAASLDGKARKKRILLWWLLPAAVALGIALVYGLYSLQPEVKGSQPSATTTEQTAPAPITIPETNKAEPRTEKPETSSPKQEASANNPASSPSGDNPQAGSIASGNTTSTPERDRQYKPNKRDK